MIIAFDISDSAKDALNRLMENHQFQNASEIVSFALINFEALQQGEHSLSSALTVAKNTRTDTAGAVMDKQPRHYPIAQVPELFTKHQIIAEGVQVVEMTPQPHQENEAPPQDWLFGQYNRFFPAKVACRGLLNYQHATGRLLPIEDAALKISDAACDLGDLLENIDTARAHSRSNEFSLAFPSSHAGDGARQRFTNQFIGSVRKGTLSGFPASLGFMVIPPKNLFQIALTKPGFEFANMTNPILDGKSHDAVASLSAEERAFLLSHIMANVWQEWSAYRTILQGIRSGADNPEKLDLFLRRHFRLLDETAITATFLATQRTGALTRMVDLGLIERNKNGLRVTYSISESGNRIEGGTA